MEKQGANVTQNNQYLYLFGPGQSQLNYLNIRLTDNTTTSQTVMYRGPGGQSSTTATVNLGNFNWALNGDSAIDSFRSSGTSNPQRHLSLTGSKQSSLTLNGKNFGMKLGGDVKLEISNLNGVTISSPSGSTTPVGAAIAAVAASNQQHVENVKLIVNSVNLLKIEGNVNHGVASYGNNNISLTADKILIHQDGRTRN